MAKQKSTKSERAPKGSWLVTVECTIIKEIVCDDCTEEEAREDPFDHAIGQRELGVPDWDVVDVKPNV